MTVMKLAYSKNKDIIFGLSRPIIRFKAICLTKSVKTCHKFEFFDLKFGIVPFRIVVI